MTARAITATLASMALGLVAGTRGQSPSPPRPEFALHLPAGELTLQGLLDQVGAALGRPVVAHSNELRHAVADRVRLQTALTLRGDAAHDLISALLYARGLVLTRQGDRHEVLAWNGGDPRRIVERAEPLPLSELGRRPALRQPVAVTFATSVPVAVASSMLHLHRMTPLSLDSADDKLIATGMSDVVQFAIGQIAMADPNLAKVLRRPTAAPWPRDAGATRFALERGRHTVRSLADRLAQALGGNILMIDSELADAAPIEIADPLELDALAFEVLIRRRLADAGFFVLGVAPDSGLHDLVPMDSTRALAATRLAQPMTAAEVLARPGLVALVRVEFAVADLGREQTMAVIRQTLAPTAGAAAAAGRITATVQGMPDHLEFTGLAEDARTVGLALAEAKAAAGSPVKK